MEAFMKKILIILLLAVICFPAIAQEINLGASFDVYSSVYMYQGYYGFIYDETLNFSSTISLGYLHRFAGEALKVGLGVSAWIPRSASSGYMPRDSSRQLSFSDVAGYATIQLYPLRFAKIQNLAANLYAKANLGYHHPILFDEWADEYLYSAWGGFHYGAGIGFDFPKWVFLELLYNGYYWGADIWNVSELDNAEFENFAVTLGFKFAFGKNRKY